MFGTLQLLDTLAAARNTLVADFGEDKTFEQIMIALEVENRLTNETIDIFVERTSDKMRAYGGTSTMVMQKLDEFGQPDVQKGAVGETLGFPMDFYGAAVGWTRHYFQQATVEEFAAQFDMLRRADQVRLRNEILRAFTLPTNYTFVDHLDRQQLSLAVKAMINADSSSIPLGPNGESFDGSTHTHYLARAGGSVAASDITALIDTVVEHHSVGTAQLYIARAQEPAVRAFTSNFLAYTPVNVVPSDNTVRLTGASLDVQNPNDRLIGLWDQTAEVHVKPWIPANYMIAFVQGAPKPLVMRVPERGASNGDLALLYDNEQFPLRARAFGREFGIGAWNRTNGAVLYTGDTTYAAPTIA
jgi:hypothetical protein